MDIILFNEQSLAKCHSVLALRKSEKVLSNKFTEVY